MIRTGPSVAVTDVAEPKLKLNVRGVGTPAWAVKLAVTVAPIGVASRVFSVPNVVFGTTYKCIQSVPLTDVADGDSRNVVIAPEPVRLTVVPVVIAGASHECDLVLSSGGLVPQLDDGTIGRPC